MREMLQLEEFYKKHDYFFFTFKREDSESLEKKERVYFAERPARNPASTIRAFSQALKVLRKERPDLIVSTGADVAVPMIIAGKLKEVKIAYIESFCRPIKPSISGKIAYSLADLFVYQWKPLKKHYPKGVYGGSIF